MRRLICVNPRQFEWEEVADPRLEGPSEAIVRPLAVATCDLDRAVILGRAPAATAFPFGHECVAEVVEVGDAVTTVRPGDRVVVPFQIACGECARCRRGLTANCTAVPRSAAYGLLPFGGGAWGGVLADRVRVPFADAMLVALPAGVDPAAAASASDNMPDAWRSVGPYLQEWPGADVLVLSTGGGIPLYAVGLACALGAGRVDYVDTDPERLALAESLGATAIEGPPPKWLGPYPITVEASGRPEWLAVALRSTEPGGVCTSATIYWGELTPVPLFEMYSRGGITYRTGRVDARPAIPPILELIAAGRFRPERVTSRTVAWEDAPAALAAGDWTKLVVVR